MTPRTLRVSSRRQFLGGTLAAVAASGWFVDSRVTAQQRGGSFVLVHGGWHGGWCWRRVADRLTAKGHYVVAPTLTGVGERSHQASDSITLSTHVDDVVNKRPFHRWHNDAERQKESIPSHAPGGRHEDVPPRLKQHVSRPQR